MADVIQRAAIASFTGSNAWQLADTGGIQRTRTSSTSTTTSAVASPNFTLTSGKTTDGVLLHLNRLIATGTFTVQLFDGTSVVADVTVNTSVLSTNRSWLFFKWDTPYLSTGLATMSIRVLSSTNASISMARSATAADWAKLICITDTATIAASDNAWPVGEWTSASGGTLTRYALTYAETATTQYGTLIRGEGSDWTQTKAAATAYEYRFTQHEGWQGATLDGGTDGTPLPSDSSINHQTLNSTNVDFGYQEFAGSTASWVWAASTTYKTRGLKLAANAAAAATSGTLTTTPSNWRNLDEVAFAPTTQTSTQFEKRSLNANVTTTAFTWTTGLTSAHSGTSPTQGEIINLTRGIKFRGTSSTLQAYVDIASGSTCTFKNCEFTLLGSATAGKRGVRIQNVATIIGCSLHDFIVAGSVGFESHGAAGASISDIDFYNMGDTFALMSGAAAVTLTNWVGIGTVNNGSGNGFQFGTVNTAAFVCTGFTAAGCANKGFILPGNAITLEASGATLQNWTSHSNASDGFSFTNPLTFLVGNGNYTIDTIAIWRNGNVGIQLTRDGSFAGVKFKNGSIFGNAGGGIQLGATNNPSDLTFESLTIGADSTFAQPWGLDLSGDGVIIRVRLVSCILGSPVTHAATGDIKITANVGSSVLALSDIALVNTQLLSATEISNQVGLHGKSWIGSSRHDGSAGSHRAWGRTGTDTSDTGISVSGKSLRQTPNNATAYCKNNFRTFKARVANGASKTIGIKVRKSVVGDGTAYNGSQPQLWLKENAAAGIAQDTLLATATNAANGAFEAISGSTGTVTDDAVLEFEVRCDGTTGWINCDDFSST